MLSFDPCHKTDEDRLRVHRKVTKMIKELGNQQYEEKLKELGFFILEKRDLKGICIIMHHCL